MEVSVDDDHLLTGFLMLKEADERLVVSLEVTVPVVLIGNVVVIHLLSCNEFKLVFLVANQDCIHVAAVVKLTFIAMLSELGSVHTMIIVNFLEAHDVGETVSIVKDFLQNST